MTDVVRVKMKLEYPGASLAEFGWADLREFMDRLLPALAAMPGEPDVEHVIPVHVGEGSVTPVVQMPRAAHRALMILQAGPRRSWTAERRKRVEPFYDFLRARGATVQVGVRTLKPFVVPDATPRWQRHEHTTLFGEVQRAGGNEGKVEILFERDGRVSCSAGKELAARMGHHLYQPVYVEGESVRDAPTGALVRFSITDFRTAVRTPPLEGLRRIRALMGDSSKDFDPDKALTELRR